MTTIKPGERPIMWALADRSQAPADIVWTTGTVEQCNAWASTLEPGTIWIARETHKSPETAIAYVRTGGDVAGLARPPRPDRVCRLCGATAGPTDRLTHDERGTAHTRCMKNERGW